MDVDDSQGFSMDLNNYVSHTFNIDVGCWKLVFLNLKIDYSNIYSKCIKDVIFKLPVAPWHCLNRWYQLGAIFLVSTIAVSPWGFLLVESMGCHISIHIIAYIEWFVMIFA